MNKYRLVEQLLGIVQGELAATLGAVTQARDNAVHEQSKPENQYDTLALEAAYLAHGQSVRAAELQRQVTVLKYLKFTDYAPGSVVTSGAIVQLQDLLSVRYQWLWILPVCGGIVLQCEGVINERRLTTITPDAPLAHKILGCYEGDEVALRLDENVKYFEIVAIR